MDNDTEEVLGVMNLLQTTDFLGRRVRVSLEPQISLLLVDCGAFLPRTVSQDWPAGAAGLETAQPCTTMPTLPLLGSSHGFLLQGVGYRMPKSMASGFRETGPAFWV